MIDYDQNSFSTVSETYKIWKKHSPFLYNIIQTYPLSTCSQTVEWFSQHYLENDWKVHNLAIGTNSLAENAVMILKVGLPTDDAITDYASYKDEAQEGEIGANGYIGTMGVHALSPKITIPQASQIMKIRINRKDQHLLAVKTGGVNPELIVYDLRNKEHELQITAIKLAGHENEGFGLSWSPLINGRLLSGSDDKKLFSYDVAHPDIESAKWQASSGVEDVKWSNTEENIFATAQQDEKICIWDTRSNESKASLTRKAHKGEVYSLDFNQKNQHLLLSGGEDGDVCFWDIRNFSKKLHTFVGHNDSVNVVAWNPRHSMQFASGSSDRKVVLWDIERLNMNTQQKSGHQIMFIHSGHRTKVLDLGWGPDKQLLASTEENSTLQVWKMNERISEV